MRQPLAYLPDLSGVRINNTLHGRSVFRKANSPGHNVFKGYSTPGTGDAIDLFCDPGTPVFAVAVGLTITRWQNDTSRKEVVYVEGVSGDGRRVTAVYAHIDFNEKDYRVGSKTKDEVAIGWVRSDLDDPHLHFELWLDGEAVSAITSTVLRTKLNNVFSKPTEDPVGPSDWAKEAWDWCTEEGILDGTRPLDNLSRQELAVVLKRFYNI